MTAKVIPIAPHMDLIAPLTETRDWIAIRRAAIVRLSEQIEEAHDEAERVQLGAALRRAIEWQPIRGEVPR